MMVGWAVLAHNLWMLAHLEKVPPEHEAAASLRANRYRAKESVSLNPGGKNCVQGEQKTAPKLPEITVGMENRNSNPEPSMQMSLSRQGTLKITPCWDRLYPTSNNCSSIPRVRSGDYKESESRLLRPATEKNKLEARSTFLESALLHLSRLSLVKESETYSHIR